MKTLNILYSFALHNDKSLHFLKKAIRDSVFILLHCRIYLIAKTKHYNFDENTDCILFDTRFPKKNSFYVLQNQKKRKN